MSTVATRPSITTVPVSALFPSPLNPRKSFDLTRLQALAESIAAQGVLQNLVVRSRGNIYEIAAGERRYRAVMSLVEAGRLAPTFELPVVVRILSDLELLEIAMSENVKRADMHPLEEADGYLKMVELGKNADSIATAVGVATSSVQKRLKIAENLRDTGRKHLLGGEMTLAQAQALVIAPKKDQEAYLKGRSGYMGDPRNIKRALMDRRPPTDRAFFKLSDYTRRGGTIVADLFGDDPNAGFFVDYALFIELQKEAMEAKKVALEKKGKSVHLEFEDYYQGDVYRRYGHREGHTLLTLENTGEVKIHKNSGPPEPRKKEAAKSDPTADDTPKPPQKNKKRLAFEDQALTRAAQRGVYKSQRLAMILAIAGAYRTGGLRHSHTDHHQTVRDPAYQDVELQEEMQAFGAALYTNLGEQYSEEEKRDLLDGPVHSLWRNDLRATQLLDFLNVMDDRDLALAFRAVMASHVEAVFEGEAKELHTWLLEQTQPDMHDFFYRRRRLSPGV